MSFANHRWARSVADEAAPAADSGRRIRALQAGFALMMLLVLGRVVMLECSQGAAFRATAARLLEKPRVIPGARGRIVSSDGLVLAADERFASLAIHYRYLEEPPSPRWLRSQARARIPRDEPNRAARLAAEEAWVRAYRRNLLETVGRLCGRPVDELQAETRRVQSRVRAIAAAVNAQRQQETGGESSSSESDQWATALYTGQQYLPWLFAPADARAPARIIVTEELDYHIIVSDVPLEVVAEVESRPEAYPGIRIVEQSRRHYLAGTLAANVVGYLGANDAPPANSGRQSLVGRQGIERQREASLGGRDGRVIDLTDHGGHLQGTRREREPAAGRDIVLSIDARLQRIAEDALDRAVARSATRTATSDGAALRSTSSRAAGGAIIALDVNTGEILASASAPRYNPNVFAERDSEAIAALLDNAGHPLFDRATQMALPPGSVFKVVTAATLLEDPRFDPAEPFFCQGFLQQPDRQRCQIFRRQGIGHEELGLADALARSCNVYFFHHAAHLGPSTLDPTAPGASPLAACAVRLGFGRVTGVDLPGEAAGYVPNANASATADPEWTLADTQAMAIGQSRLTVTPLQVARLMAAIANGGQLVRPRFVKDVSESPNRSFSPPAPSAGLSRRQIAELRSALARVVEDPEGTAHEALADAGVAVAGKTGTAEAGAGAADHAWFAGYAPAEAPRVAFVVVLEHGGAADRAALVAKDVVQAMQALGLLEARDEVNVARAKSD
ncbi:MAG TPA: penicillin-binding transpeptidase domain-containing protein [Pirellulales bacterium]|jgi:penicillin-binding protein 2